MATGLGSHIHFWVNGKHPTALTSALQTACYTAHVHELKASLGGYTGPVSGGAAAPLTGGVSE